MSSMNFVILLLLINLVMFNSGRLRYFSYFSFGLFDDLAYRLNQHYYEDEYDSPSVNEDLADRKDCFPFCLMQSPLPPIEQPSRRDTYFLRFGRKR